MRYFYQYTQKHYMRIEAVALVAMMFICGCAGNSQLQMDCAKELKPAIKDQCYYNRSVIKSESPMCLDIKNEKMRSDCINEVAVQVLDYMACKQHDKVPARDKCENLVSDARHKAKAANPNIKLP
jgi:hypothetical protein